MREMTVSAAVRISAKILQPYHRRCEDLRFLYSTNGPGFVSQKNGFYIRSTSEWPGAGSLPHRNDE